MNIIYTVMGTTMLVAGGLGYWYYNHSQDKIANLQQANATLQANNLTLNNELQAQNEDIVRLKKQIEEEHERIRVMEETLNQAREETAKLRAVFDKHNLEFLSLKKPALIEKRINKGTEAVFKDFELLTQPAKPSTGTSP